MFKQLRLSWYLSVYEFHLKEYFKKMEMAKGMNNFALKDQIRNNARWNLHLMNKSLQSMLGLMPQDEWVKIGGKYVLFDPTSTGETKCLQIEEA